MKFSSEVLLSPVLRLRSVGLDVLKQRGQWQVGREQPSDLGLEFDDLFNHEVEEKAEEITRETSMTNSEARLLLSKTFQVIRMWELFTNHLRDIST